MSKSPTRKRPSHWGQVKLWGLGFFYGFYLSAGPINLAKEIICKDNEEQLFFVFNSDIICDFPLEKLIAFHKAHGKEGTIMVKY